MTRETISTVFVAVLLVLASGTAVSLSVTDSSTADAGTNAVGVQEQETASVTFNEQESDGEQVVVESATLPEGGFIAIHDASYAEAPLSSVLGNSVYLEAGTHENVTITLARPIPEDQPLAAMLHRDTNDNQVFDFVLSTGGLDGAYTADGEAVVDEANVTVAQETTTTTEDVDDDETTTEDVDETTTVVDDVTPTTTEDVDETTTTEAPAETERFIFQVEQMNIDEWSFVVGDEEEPDRTETLSDVTITDRRVNINLSEMLRQSAAAQEAAGPMTTVSPEQAEEMLQENLTQDIQTVRYVISDITIENVTFVVTAPEDIELPQPPMTTPEDDVETTPEDVETTPEDVETTPEDVETTPEDDVETTPEDVETTTEIDIETTPEDDVETTPEVDVETTPEDDVETTPEDDVETTPEDDVETTPEVDVETTPEDDVETTPEVDVETTPEDVEETTTTEEEDVETTPEEDVEETTPEEDVETTPEEDVEETTTTEEDIETAELESFEVSNLDAPSNATTDDTITVSATVSNPNDQEATQPVTFRLEGTVIARQQVTLDAGEQTTVTFELDTTGVPTGEYIHGVYTRGFGELGVLVLEEPTEETTTTTEEAADGETTTVAA